jgi:hypothetical protein
MEWYRKLMKNWKHFRELVIKPLRGDESGLRISCFSGRYAHSQIDDAMEAYFRKNVVETEKDAKKSLERRSLE